MTEEVPENWKRKKLRDILEIGSGRDYKHLGKGDIPVYGTGGHMLSVDDYLYEGESVGIGRKGTIDKPVYLTGKFWTVDTLFYTHSFKEVLPYYVYLLFQTINWKQHNEATGVPSLSKVIIQNIKIVLPPLQEQQKIADILSTVDEKIEAIDQQIVETEELKKGLMQRLFTKGIGHNEFKDSPLGKIPKSWEAIKQSEVATFFNGRAYKLSEWETQGTPVIRLQNLTGSGKDFYYSKMSLPDHQYCHSGDLLYMWSATFGPVFWNGPKAIFHYHIWKIEHTPRLEKLFHFYLLDDVTRRMKNESHGSTMLHVTKGGMEKLLIQVPPLEEQQKIASVIGSVDEKIRILNDKKNSYSILKKGLMQQLLTGKIRVNNPVEA